FESTAPIGKKKAPAGGRKLEKGSDSLTRFKLLKSKGEKSLLEVTPSTGRTNQIRLHLAGLKLPIRGDLGYANPEYFENKPLTYPEDTLFLHAWKLQFTHPTTKEQLQFEAPLNNKWKPYI
ncbi:MAG: pseudouridine synthase, partial [Salibacteraceae bacterium]